MKKNSLAERHGLKPGDRIVSINQRPLKDILDYEIASSESDLEVVLITKGGLEESIKIKNRRFESLGIYFSTSLFDGIKTCRNNCIFCFIDQLPKGMREAVYVKDDDYRLSFLYGNFVTLTNIEDDDVRRIIDDRISPLYVSLHASDPDLRSRMLGRKKADKTMEYIEIMSEAGIEIHVQIVLCPGINDGEQLENTLLDLSGVTGIASVGIVPVGLTGYRDALYALRSFEIREVNELIEQVEKHQEVSKKRIGNPWVYLADEFYIMAEKELPENEHYGDYPQIENGIGLSRLFIEDAWRQAETYKDAERKWLYDDALIITGELFAPTLERSIMEMTNRFIKAGAISEAMTKGFPKVLPVKNKYFGGKVNVTGLLTGYDIISAVKEIKKPEDFKDTVVLIPDVVLNADGFLLDGISPEVIAKELGMRIIILGCIGDELVKGLLGPI